VFLFVLAVGFATSVLHVFVLLSIRFPGPAILNWRHMALNYALLGVLGAAYLAWRVARHLHWVSPATGNGFVLAGYALLQRVFAEFLVSLMDAPPGSLIDGLDEYYAMVRGSGLVGFVFGLALVLASALAERRLRRHAPDWAFPD
jgi:hypothetical protein